MIKTVLGRAVSERTEGEAMELATAKFKALAPSEQKTVLSMLAEMDSGDDTLLSLVHASHWKRPPVSMKQFLEDDYYMGISASGLYPKLKDDLIRLFDDGDYAEVILAGAIGYGKSTFAAFVVARVLYEVSCLRDPQQSFGLSPGSEIHFALVSKNLEQTKKVLRSKIIEPMRISPYFQEEFKWKEKEYEDRFPNNVVMFVASVNSMDRILGSNLFGAAVDEINFLGNHSQAKMDTAAGRKGLAAYDKADKLYSNIIRRIKSRFAHTGTLPGKVCLISSKTIKESFTDRRIRQSKLDPTVFVLDYAPWDVKPKTAFSSKWFRVLVGGVSSRSRILDDEEELDKVFLEETGSIIIKVPETFRGDFEEDLVNALRDIAGVSVESLTQFISRQEKIQSCVDDELKHPFTVDEWTYGEDASFRWGDICTVKKRKIAHGFTENYWVPNRRPEASRHVHVDVAVSGDSLGIAMGHVVKMVSVIRRDPNGEKYADLAPEMEIDFKLRVRPPVGEQIFLPDIRGLVYSLMEHGFQVESFSADGFQSTEMLQQMRVRGVSSEVISVDKTTGPYNLMRQAMYEDRLKVYKYKPFIDECMTLEFDAVRGKVDHPLAGSKDVTDAVAGVVEGLRRHATKAPLPMLHSVQHSEDTEDESWVTEGKKQTPVPGTGGPLKPFLMG